MENVTSSLSGVICEQSIKERSSVLNDSFCNYVFSEDAKALRKTIRDITNENSEFTIDDFVKLLEYINESDMTDDAKKFAVGLVSETYNTINSTGYSSNVLKESVSLDIDPTLFDGNPKLNAEFIKSLKEIEKFAGYLVEVFESDYGMGDEILARVERCASEAQNKEDIQKCMSDCKNIFANYFSKVDNDPRRKAYFDNYRNFKQLSKTFNNRYSKITMAEKEKVDTVLDEMVGKVYSGIVRDWFKFSDIGNTPVKNNRMFDAYLKIREIDYDACGELTANVLNPLLKFLAGSWIDALNSINYIRKLFGIRLKNTVRWKIVHTVFK